MSTSDSAAAAAAPIAADTQSNPPGEDGSSATGCDSSVGAYPSAWSRVSGDAQVLVLPGRGQRRGGGLTALLWASMAC